jgi:predicted ATPase
MHNHIDVLVPQTMNGYVITGAPCSGKTSVIEGLSRRGCKVVPEAARAYIDSQLNLGYSLEEIKSDILSFERHILHAKVRIEKKLSKTQNVFLDRAIPDSIAYFQLVGLAWTEPLAYSRMFRYKKIFMFDQLAFEKDAVRSENPILSAHIESLLEQCYRDLGYPITRVPALPIDQRIEFILANISSE